MNRLLRPMIGLLFVSLCLPLAADETKTALKATTAPKFTRLLRDAKGQPAALQTATVRYAPASGTGVAVDLIGVVHIGDRKYYEKLNKQMEQYDVLLYELVAEPGTRIPKGGKREADNPLSMIHLGLKSMLELDLQTEQIDYTKKNFVHADLSPEQMAEAMKKRGDTALTVAISVIADLMRQANLQEQKLQEKVKEQKEKAKEQKEAPREEEPDLLTMLLDPQGPAKMKRAMAEQLASDDALAGLGQTLNTLLIRDRNDAALKALQKELAKGRKKIGIFYGAAHMPDFDQHLRADFDLKPVGGEQWLTAWDLTRRAKPKNPFGDLLKRFWE